MDMDMTDEMGLDISIPESLLAQAIGSLVMKYIKSLQIEELLPLIDSEAMRLLSEIKAVLDDDTEEDANCFYRIEAIVDAFNDRHINIVRHDW